MLGATLIKYGGPVKLDGFEVDGDSVVHVSIFSCPVPIAAAMVRNIVTLWLG